MSSLEEHAETDSQASATFFDMDALALLIERFRQKFGTFESREYMAEEREYKLVAAAKLSEILDQAVLKNLIAAGAFEEAHRLVRQAMWGNNLLNQWDVRPAIDAAPDATVMALYELLYGDADFSERFNAWVAVLSTVKTTCWPTATYYLMLHEPERYIFVKPTPFRTLIKQIKATISWQTNPTAAAYQQILDLSAAILEQLRPLGAKDMIDVQSFIWIVQQQSGEDTDASSEDDEDDSDTPESGLSLEQWREQIDTVHPLALRIAAEYPEWLENTFGSRIEFRPGNRQTFWVLIDGRWMQRGRINKRGGMWMWLRTRLDEDQQTLHSRLDDPSTLRERTVDTLDGQRFIINSESDYQLLQDMTRRMVERSLEQRWPGAGGGPAFVVIHSRDQGDQVYGETYVYTNYAGGAHRQLTQALAAAQDGGRPVRLIIYRPAPHYAFTAWAEVVDMAVEQGQRTNETRYSLTLDQHEFPVPLSLRGNGAGLIRKLPWLNKGLAVAFRGFSIRPLPDGEFRTIIEAARKALGEGMTVNDAAYAILSNAGGPLSLEDIIKHAKQRGLLADTVADSDYTASLSSSLRYDKRFNDLGDGSWRLAPAADPEGDELRLPLSMADAAFRILSRSDEPLHVTSILEQSLAEGLFTTQGKTPELSLSSAMLRDERFANLGSNRWALRDTLLVDEPLEETEAAPGARCWRIHFPRPLWDDVRAYGVIGVDFRANPTNQSMQRFRSIAAGDRVIAYVQGGVIGGIGVITRPYSEDNPQSDTPDSLFGGNYPQRLGVAWSDAPAEPKNILKDLQSDEHRDLYNRLKNPHTVMPLKPQDYKILLHLTGGTEPVAPETRLPTAWPNLSDFQQFALTLEPRPYGAAELHALAMGLGADIDPDTDSLTLVENLRQLRLLTTQGDGYQIQPYVTAHPSCLRLMALALLIITEGAADSYTLPSRAIMQRHGRTAAPSGLEQFAPELAADGPTLLGWYAEAGLVTLEGDTWQWSVGAFDPPAEDNPAVRMYAAFLRTLLDDSAGQLRTDIDHASGPLPVAANREAGLRELGEDMLIDDQILRRIYRSLVAGRNIVLSGPPGTGKTELARRLPTLLWQEPAQEFTRLTTELEQAPIEPISVRRMGYRPIIVTATEDWGVRDIVGGIAPRLNSDNGSVAYDMQYGHLTQVLLRHYAGTDGGRRPPTTDTYTRRDYIEDTRRYRGAWLVIDEFTRAPVDAAFGGLLTTLGGGENAHLTAPAGDSGSVSIPLPADFRIIGTLNSFDRHFLNQMSEAIKRRFDFIDVLPPPASYAHFERGIAARAALSRLQAQGFGAIVQINRGAGRPAYQFGEVLAEPVSDEHGYPRYELSAGGEAAAALDSFWRLFEVIRIFRQLGTAQAIAVYTNIFAGALVEMEWPHALDTALADSLVDQLQVMTRDEQRILRAYVDLADNSSQLANQVNTIIGALPANRRPELYSLLREVDEARHGTSDIAQTITEKQAARLFNTGQPLALPRDSVFRRRLRALISERGL